MGAFGGGQDLGSAVLELRTDMSHLNKGIEESKQRIGTLGITASIIGAQIGIALGRGLANQLASSISGASDLAESISMVNVVFGESAREILEWSDDSAFAFGQSQQAALQMVGTYGALFSAFGIGTEDAKEMSTTLVELGADLASFYNTSVADAIQAIRSGLSGETEPLKRYGIVLSDVRLKQEALTQGIIETTKDALTPAAKAQAAYGLIMQDTSLVQGDFERTSEGLANQQRILAAAFTDVKTAIGTALLPVITAAINDFTEFFSANEENIEVFIAVIKKASTEASEFFGIFIDREDLIIIAGALFATLVAGFIAVGVAAAASFIAANAALFGIPLLIAGAVAAIVILVRHWDELTKAAEDVWNKHKVLITVFGVVTAFAFPLIGAIGLLIAAGVALAKNWGAVSNAIGTAWSAIVDIINSGVNKAINTINVLIGALNGAASAIASVLNSIPDVNIPDWLPGPGGSFGIPDVKPLEIEIIPNVNLEGIDFPSIGFDIGMDMGLGLGDALGANGAGLPDDLLDDWAGDLGLGAGEAAGTAAAASLVPAFVQEMQRRESIADIIEQAISAREINWSDVARLYELGAVEVAQDFTAALLGEVSQIGAKIWVAAWEEGQREAWKAGVEAAKAYTDAFASGLDELQSAISTAFGSLDSFVGTRTMEDAQLELDILIAQRDALQPLIDMEERRAELVQQIADVGVWAEEKIARVQERAASQIANIQQHIAAHEQTILALQANIKADQNAIDDVKDAADAQIAVIQASIQANEQIISSLRAGIRAHQQQIKEIQAATDAQVASVQAAIDANEQIIDSMQDGIKNQQRAIKEIEKAASAQIAVIEAGIDANQGILTSLEKQLKIKQETLKADQATLSIYEKTFAEHEKLLKGFESQLKTLQDERESAWKILGMAPGGGVLPPTLSEAATKLKALQDDMAELLAAGGAWDVNDLGNWNEEGTAATPEFTALQESIAEARRQFEELDAQAQAEIASTQNKIVAQATLIAQDQVLIDGIAAKIAADQADIESTQFVIDATKELIATDRELIAAIRDTAAAEKAVIQEQIELAQEAIDVVREQIDLEREQIDAIRDASESQVASVQAQIDATQALIDATQNNIESMRDQIDVIKANAEAEVDALRANIDATNDLIDATKAKIEADEAQIDAIENAAAAAIATIEAQADARVEALQAEVGQVDASIANIKKHIGALQDEQAARELDRQILQRQLELQHELLPTDWELLRTMLEQIQLAQQLQTVYDNMRNHALSARDAFVLLGLGMEGLADLVMQIIANPSLYSLFGNIPSFAGGGVVPGNAGQPVLAVVHAGETISDGTPVVINMTNTYNGTQNIAEVEQAQKRVLNKSLRAAGLLV